MPPVTPSTSGSRLIHGDCLNVLPKLEPGSVDLVLTDPPYLVNYRDRSGRSIAGDRNGDWVRPAFAGIYNAMKPDSLCVSFYSWNRVDTFMAAWKAVGLTPVGHIVWRKPYASNSRFLSYSHEQAYLLAKGRPSVPENPIRDVQDWKYTGNILPPNQKPVENLIALIESFTRPGDLVLDPFAGSGSTAEAALATGRRFTAIEKDRRYFEIARDRLYAIREMREAA
jgi:site-specific DNA-methyltransferase (adenine-specific)